MKKIQFILLIFLLFLVGSIHASTYNIIDFGAKPNKGLDCTTSIQNAIDKCSKQGGGEVIVPSGTFNTGTLFLRSNVNLKLEAGAVLQGSYHTADYPFISLTPYFQGLEKRKIPYQKNIRALLIAERVENVQITGYGEIRGAGDGAEFHPEGDRKGYFPDLDTIPRPFNVLFLGSKKITLRDFKTVNSAAWSVAVLDCDDATIDGLHVKSDANWTSDGIDLSGSNITVSNCMVDTEDDAICLKGEYGDRPCENISIINCVVASQCNGIKLGTSSHTGFKNITVSNCIIKKPSLNGFRHNHFSEKEVFNPDDNSVITGIVVIGVDGGIVENISFNNIVMTDVLCPFYIRVGDRQRNEQGQLSLMRNISLSNITARVRSILPAMISGQPESPVQDVRLSNIQIEYEMAVDSTFFATFPATVHENKSGYPECTITFGRRIPASALFAKNIEGLFIDGFYIRRKPQEARSLFHFENVNWLHTNRIFDNRNPIIGLIGDIKN